MPNCRDISTDNIKLKVLVYGGSGTGKTSFASTFPKPYFFDFDGGMLSVKGKDIEYDTFQDQDQDRPNAYAQFSARFKELNDLASIGDGNFPFETLVLDSMTTLQEALMRNIQSGNRTMAKNPNLAEWGMLINTLQDILYKFTSMNVHVVVTAHEQIVQDDLTSEVQILPLVTGKKLPDRMPLWFDEVYHTRVGRGQGNTAKYEIMTQASYKYKAKSRLQCLQTIEEGLTYSKIMDKLNQAGSATVSATTN